MFGFSIQKLIFTVAIIAAVWYGFKWVGRMKVKRDEDARQRLKREQGAGGAAASGPSSNPGDAEEMIECEACGAFVASVGATACGRGDCPYPG